MGLRIWVEIWVSLGFTRGVIQKVQAVGSMVCGYFHQKLESLIKPMTNQIKFTTLASLAALIAAPMVSAEEAAQTVPEIIICEPCPEIIVCPGVEGISPEPIEKPIHIDPMHELPQTGEALGVGAETEEPTDELVSVPDGGQDGVSVTDEDGQMFTLGGNGVPISWLLRSNTQGGSSDGATAGAPMPALINESALSAVSPEPAKDNEGGEIVMEASTSAPQMKSANGKPVALIKKGRVFLR